MAQEDPNPWSEWFLLLKQQAATARQRLLDWWAAVGEEPHLIWQTVAVRYTVYGVGGLVLVWVLLKIPGMIAPPARVTARPVATTADFHVVCSNPECERHFVIHRDFGFRKFPVRCSQCAQVTGQRARKCSSPHCRGRWVAPLEQDNGMRCPRCGVAME